MVVMVGLIGRMSMPYPYQRIDQANQNMSRTGATLLIIPLSKKDNHRLDLSGFQNNQSDLRGEEGLDFIRISVYLGLLI